MESPQGSEGLSTTPSPTFSAASTVRGSAPRERRCEKSPACYTRNCDDPYDECNEPCHGWPQLVKVMVEKPGFESFQSFRDLNIKSLLYYQAELVELRKELHSLEWKDHRKNGEPAEHFCQNIQTLLLSKVNSEERKRQLSTVNEIRKVLKDYNAALLQYAEINKLPKADTFNVQSLRNWIFANRFTNLQISGPGAHSWGKGEKQPEVRLWCEFWKMLKSIFRDEKLQEDHLQLDLVVPGKDEDTDSLTRWVASQGTPFWHHLKRAFEKTKIYKAVAPRWRFLCKPFRRTEEERRSKDELPRSASGEMNSRKPSIISIIKRRMSQQETPVDNEKEGNLASLSTYSMYSIVRFTNFVATIVACLLPIVGIVVLSELHTKAMTLGFIALFTGIFATGIMILTNSRNSRTEVFTATAAFAAVLVVFVQNQSPGSVGG